MEQIDRCEQGIDERLKQLNQLYKQIPDADCSNCNRRGECCLSVFVRAIEFENIQRYMDEYLGDEQKRSIRKQVLENYHIRSIYMQAGKKTSLRLRCLFLNNVGKCMIYSIRPLVCRINAGLVAKQDLKISDIDGYYIYLDNDYITNVQLMEFWLMFKIVGAKKVVELIRNDGLASRRNLHNLDFKNSLPKNLNRRLRRPNTCILDRISKTQNLH
ncbi:MAG: YkgJ family cysteine cluster protein [Candidatus Omnitrophota bacterium]